MTAAVVRVRDGVADLEEDRAALDALHSPGFVLGEPLVEGAALHELHREVRDAVRVDRELVDRDDVRVLELTRHLRLGDECVAVEALVA